MKHRVQLTALSLLLLAGAAAVAAPRDAVIDPAKAGPDYALQGEYAGEAGGEKLGAQVIALGNGGFQACFLPGGLPGAGWDGKTRIRVDGKADGSSVHFQSGNTGWTAALANGKLTGKTGKDAAFSLSRTVRRSPAEGAKAPAGALVLFDGKNADAWVNGRVTPEGLLMEGAQTKQAFKDFTLHVEFMTSFMPEARGQGRANSGVFLDGRYEIQVLDSFGLDGRNNECGGLYSVKAPDVNMCFPPLTWQTYDIEFQAPVFDDQGVKTRNGVVTVRHNGILIHDRVEVPKNTAGGQEGPTLGPIQVMNHGNPVRFRNIWVVEKK
jgi:hypothetical protein